MQNPEVDEKWGAFMTQAKQLLQALDSSLEVSGRLTRLTGVVLEASGIRASVGSQFLVQMNKQQSVLAEVVGFSDKQAFLMLAGHVQGLSSGAAVMPVPSGMAKLRLGDSPQIGHGRLAQGALRLPLGDGLLGRVVDAQGTPLDHLGPLVDVVPKPLNTTPINAMDRAPVREALDTGVRAINALFTVGRGQRMGLFAGSGVGKSVLLGMMARYTQADVIVVGLIGERGREVKEFIDQILGEAGLARAVVVAAPSDAPPLLQMQGAAYATAVAEDFRDQGRHVLLLMDSLTRYAMAQREIALAIGEAPATKGYPPSCFAKLPQLVERSGNGLEGQGSITAFYTVLTEGDDQQDPIADSARSILDGHIVLSRPLAEAGHFPAIDIAQSASRVMHGVVPASHLASAMRFRSLHSRFEQGRDLVQLGAYVSGSDAQLDEALGLHDPMMEFLRQDMSVAAPLAMSVQGLMRATGPEIREF